jgi:hypothetical protein
MLITGARYTQNISSTKSTSESDNCYELRNGASRCCSLLTRPKDLGLLGSTEVR